MTCPTCRKPYRWYETVCPECGVDLEESPSSEGADVDLVAVFHAREGGQLPLAEMALRSEQIDYIVRRGTSGASPVMQVGVSDLNDPLGSAQILVRPENEARARVLLDDLDREGGGMIEGSTPVVTPVTPGTGDRGSGPIRLVEAERGFEMARVSEEQLQQLLDNLEEDPERPDEFYLDGATLDLLLDAGVDRPLVEILRQAAGGREGLQVRWQDGRTS